MSNDNFTPIVNADSRKNDKAIWNDPMGELDAAMGDVSTLTTTATTLTTGINELDTKIGTAASSSGTLGTAIDTDGTLKAGAVDVPGVMGSEVVTDAALASAIRHRNAMYVPNGRVTWDPTSKKLTVPASYVYWGNNTSARYLGVSAQTIDFSGVTSGHTAWAYITGVVPGTTQPTTTVVVETDATLSVDVRKTDVVVVAYYNLSSTGYRMECPFGYDTRLLNSLPNLIPDPFNRTLAPGETWGGRERWVYAHVLSIVTGDSGNPYMGGNTLRVSSASNYGGKVLWLDEAGLRVGDLLTVAANMMAASGDWALYCTFKTSPTGSIVASANTTPMTYSGAAASMYITATVPATATMANVYVYKTTTGVTADIYAFWAWNDSRMVSPAPSTPGELVQRAAFPKAQVDFGRGYLRSWFGQLGKIAQSVSTPAKIALIGDSWINNTRISTPLRTALQTLYGDGGVGYVSAHTSQDVPTGATRTVAGTWTNVEQTAASYGVDISHAISTDDSTPGSYTMTTVCETITIHYMEIPSGGDFRYQVDSDGWNAVATAAGAAAHATVSITGLSDASHSLVIEVTTGASGVILCGVDFSKTTGAIVHKIGNGGATAGEFAQVDATIWQAGITAIAPNLAIILLSTNDYFTNITPRAFADSMATVVSRIRAAVPSCDIMLVAPSGNNYSGTYPMTHYIYRVRDIAVTNGWACVDLYQQIGTYTEANGRGLMQDAGHLNVYGGQQAADVIAKMLTA